MTRDLPALRVVRGEPTAEELAAVVVALLSRRGEAASGQLAASRWADPAARLRRSVHPGPGAWRWS